MNVSRFMFMFTAIVEERQLQILRIFLRRKLGRRKQGATEPGTGSTGGRNICYNDFHVLLSYY
jgi:hypothetical protein